MMIYSCVGSKTYKKYSEVLIHFMSDGSFSGRVVWPPRIVKEVLKSEQEINSNGCLFCWVARITITKAYKFLASDVF